MVKVFSIEDRKSTLDYILSTAKDCPSSMPISKEMLVEYYNDLK